MEELKSLPDWFNGKLFKEVGVVTNPISGESYELNAVDLYDWDTYPNEF